MALDASSINFIQGFLLTNASHAFSQLTIYAKHLLYYFITFEIIFAGLAWMLYQNYVAERLFFQILKIGLILFLVENYTAILNDVLSSSLMIGKSFSQNGAENFLLNPGLIWQYAYNFSVTLLQHAANAEGFAFPMILMVLGFGILLVFGLFGIQILIQVAAFYLVGAFSLLVLPLAVFSPMRDFFSRSVQSVLQAALRLMVMMLLVSGAVTVFSSVSLQSFSTGININLPLGLFFSGLLFVMASSYLPSVVEKLIGRVHWEGAPIAQPSVNISTPMISSAGASVVVSTTAAAAGLSPASAMNLREAMGSAASAATVSPHYLQAVKEGFMAQQKQLGLAASGLKAFERLSEKYHQEEIKRIKQAFYQVLNELNQPSSKAF